jgi:hypothetical protein
MNLRISRERIFNLYFIIMSNNSPKKYVGNGKKVGSYDLINFSIAMSKVREHVYEYKGEQYLRMTMGAIKDGVNEYGQTHKIWIDEYKPDATTDSPKKAESPIGDGLPF